VQVKIEVSDTQLALVVTEGSCSFVPSQEVETEHHDFAAWATLPLAMASGDQHLRIEGVGDRLVAENATKLSQVWELWMPHKFNRVEVSFDEYQSTPPGKGKLLLFSGGIDSTYNLLRLEAAGQRPHLLTVHGLDYKAADDERFESLLLHTKPIVDRASSGRNIVLTDIYDIYKRAGIDVAVGHAFALFSALFLFSNRFECGEISADYSTAQDFTVHPWGTNSLTNSMFESSTFRVMTGSADVTRSEKVAAIARDKAALHALTFCSDYSKRPLNCGICAKCVRTKAMFIAATGSVPEIFIDPAFRASSLDSMNLSKRSEEAFFVDLFLAARRNGQIAKLPGLAEKAEKYLRNKRLGHLKPGRRLEKRFTDWWRG
jgi:hypothetical protein